MNNLSDVRKKMLLALAVLGVICAACAAYLWLPLTASPRELMQETQEAREELHSKQRQVAPLENLDQKLDTARQQIDEFEKERLPAHYSEISEQLGKLASNAGVQMTDVGYLAGDTTEGLQQVRINATLSGDYSRVVRFINAAERSKMFLLVDQVGLAERQEGKVGLQIMLETYLTRPTAAAQPPQQAGD